MSRRLSVPPLRHIEILLWTFKHPEHQQWRHQSKTTTETQEGHITSKSLDPYTSTSTSTPTRKIDKNNNRAARSSDDLDPELAQLDQRKNSHQVQYERRDSDLQSGEFRFSSYDDTDDLGERIHRARDLRSDARQDCVYDNDLGDKDVKDNSEFDDAGDSDGSHKNTQTKHIRWAGYVWRRGMVPLWWQILVLIFPFNASISILIQYQQQSNTGGNEASATQNNRHTESLTTPTV